MKIGDIFESDDLNEAKPLDAAARKAMASGQAALAAREKELQQTGGRERYGQGTGYDFNPQRSDTIVNKQGKIVDAEKSRKTKQQNLAAKRKANQADFDAKWAANAEGRKQAQVNLKDKEDANRQAALDRLNQGQSTNQPQEKKPGIGDKIKGAAAGAKQGWKQGGKPDQNNGAEAEKMAQKTTAELIDTQLKQGKRDHAAQGEDGSVVDQGVLPADVETKLKQDYDEETLDAALTQTTDQFKKEGKPVFVTTTDATPEPTQGQPQGDKPRMGEPAARRPGAARKPSAENLPPVGDEEDGGRSGGGATGGSVGGGSAGNMGGQGTGPRRGETQGGKQTSAPGQMSDADAKTFVKHVKDMSKAERKWLKNALSSVSESVVMEVDDESTNAEYRIRRYAQLRGVDPKVAVRAWRDVGSPTDKGEIAGILKSLGGKRIGVMKKGATKFKDRKATAAAKKLYNWAVDNGYAKKAVSLIDYVEKNSGVIGKARKFINRMTEDTSSREYSDEFVKQLIINASSIYASKQNSDSDLVANEEAAAFSYATESAKKRMVTRLLNERAVKEDDKYVLTIQEFISLKKFFENLNVSFESAGMLVEKSNGKVIVSVKKKTLNEAKISDYFDEPVSAESLKKIISIIDSNNVGDSLSLIKKSIMSKLGSGKVESKTLRSIGDELISLSNKGIDFRGVL